MRRFLEALALVVLGSLPLVAPALAQGLMPLVPGQIPPAVLSQGKTTWPPVLPGVPPKVAGAKYVGPCDIAAKAGTPCIAAYSFTRQMWSGYSGPLFQLERASDSTTLNIGFIPSTHTVNFAAWASFCAGTTCNWNEIYDQMSASGSPGANSMPAITGSFGTTPTFVLKPVSFWPVGAPTGGGYPQVFPYFISFFSTNAATFSNRANTVNMPHGTQSITEYYVGLGNNTVSSLCCGTFGSVENTPHDDGTGSSFELGYTTYNASPAQLGIDQETLFFTPSVFTPPATFNFLAKHIQGTGQTATGVGQTVLKYANATTGKLTTFYNGADGISPTLFKLEGGITLGSGGDGTASGSTFFEGIIIAGATTDVTDNAIQANVANFYALASAPNAALGPQDIAGTAIECYSLRACYQGYATGSNDALTVHAASGPNSGSSQALVILPSGLLDVATAATFAGTDATCPSSSISTTTLTIGTCTYAGVETTLAIGDQLSGTGVAPGTYVTSTGCTSPGGTCSVSISQSVSSETITAAGALFVSTWNGQIAGKNVVQATTTNQPILLLNGGPTATLPFIHCSGSQYLINTGGFTSVSQPYSFSAIAERTGTFTSISNIIGTYNGSAGQPGMFFASSANEAALYAGTVANTAANVTDSAWHSLQGVMSGNLSFIYSDGNLTNLGPGTTAFGASTDLGVCGNPNTGTRQPLTGNEFEALVFPANITPQVAALTASAHALGGGW